MNLEQETTKTQKGMVVQIMIKYGIQDRKTINSKTFGIISPYLHDMTDNFRTCKIHLTTKIKFMSSMAAMKNF